MAKRKTKKIASFLNEAKQRFVAFGSMRKKIPTKRVLSFVDKKPFTSFFITLAALFVLILLGNVLASFGKKENKQPVVVKDAQIFSIGAAPKVSLQGQIEKSGVFKIVAQTPGIVNSINFNEGDSVFRGQPIISLSSNASGGNIPGLQAGLAQKQLQNILDTFDSQKAIINDQRKIADQTHVSSEKLRDIANQNLTDTNNLINLNQGILDTLNNQLNVLQTNNVGGANDQQILQTKQLIAQLTGGLLQLRVSSRALSFQTDTSNPPTQLSDVAKEVALKQLDIQEKALELNREASRIQAAIAGVAASLMNPATPGDGVVDRIYVKVGDSVNPGTVLALVSGNNQNVNVVVRVPFDIASRVSRTESSVLRFTSGDVLATPFYVSLEATDGQLYSIIFSIDPKDTTNGSFIKVDLPIGFSDSSTSPFIPIDAVYQTQNEAFLLVAQNSKAVGKKVSLGTVYGKFVQVMSGLKSGDQVILNRNIIAGDSVKTHF